MRIHTNLERFLKAQEKDYAIALSEIKNGKKQSHWMWYIFPQIQGLGISETSRYYALKNMQEAADYLKDAVLGKRLIDICNELLNLGNNDAHEIFGSPDDKKLHSSMTLFSSLPGTDPVFTKISDKFFAGKKDERTLQIIREEQ